MRTITLKVNKHVTYYDANCKPRPATVTDATVPATPTVRVGHSGETHATVPQAPASSLIANVPNTWRIA